MFTWFTLCMVLLCCSTGQGDDFPGNDFPGLDYPDTDFPVTTDSGPEYPYPRNDSDSTRITPDQYKLEITTSIGAVDNTIIPLDNLADTLNLTMKFNMLSLTKFNEIDGEIGVVAEIDLSWVAKNLPIWDPNTSFGGKDSIALDSDDIWTPQLILLNPSQNIKDLTNLSKRLRMHYNGLVKWKVITGLQASCSIDVTDFPFDIQTCTLKLSPWGYDSSEINVIGYDSGLDVDSIGNSGWELTHIETVGVNEVAIPHLKVSLYFKRYYEYFLINILVPPVLLSILSPCVFLCPAASGERMSFAVTCFLSFSVFISLLGDNMPKSSVPIAHISYFMMYMLIHSCSVSVCTIISLRLYSKGLGEKVPKWIQVFTKLVRLRYCVCRRREVRDSMINDHRRASSISALKMKKSNGMSSIDSELATENVRMKGQVYGIEGPAVYEHEIAWPLVARTLDYVFFFAFLGWMLFTIITFFMALQVI